MVHHDHMASAQDLFGQLWKEYALSDSRYMTSDTLVLCMETMTVVSPTTMYQHSNYSIYTLEDFTADSLIPTKLLWGPLCFVVAYLTATRHSLRHPIQLIVCMSHLYGDTLYYATSLFDDYVHGRPYSRPEPYYFWLYYFLMNFIWIIVPACMSISCSSRDSRYKLTIFLFIIDYLYHSISTISAALKRQSEKDKTK